MKTKTIVRLYIMMLSIGTILSLYIPKTEVMANESLVIPSEAIRLRILANSDSEADQELKRRIRDAVNAEITEWVEELTSIEETRRLIRSRLPEIQKIAESVVEKEKLTQAVKIDFGKVDFPTKLYGEFLYPAGEYEAILITLGEGKGANWWCVLFPPLCFLDFSNGVAVSDGFEEDDQTTQTQEIKSPTEVNEDIDLVETKQEKKPSNQKTIEKEAPVFVDKDEQEVEVKFFLKELWDKIFE
ncbi:stage II sporulation protein R [Bacillus sp. FJAT-49705]|uniref:Stage II sporulation protein R n=2 Tax=Cytobacillus citreus TaxID=2833586 RepID=A0ABS5NQH5_9BACI|nr:stage II sporulation protein R [Cytobacillus citreus]MBS4190077.1 stage II sporulation protein R [Cytobacillus citreus]